MKKNTDYSKPINVVSDALRRSVSLGKTAAHQVQKGAHAIIDKSRLDSLNRKLKKYNPVFPQDFESELFHIPNMIQIIDDAVRRDIDVCDGAIGWLKNDTGMEILCLYDEAIPFSGLKFLPVPTCDAFYYVDPFDRNIFVRTDYVFQRAHDERIAELKHIAYCLGAKRCTIETCESIEEKQHKNRRASGSENISYASATVSESMDHESSSTDSSKRSGKMNAVFSGSSQIIQPKLKWFANDENILGLIDIRLNGINTLQVEELELRGATSSALSQKAAYSIDAAVQQAGIKSSYSLGAQADREAHSKMRYKIEF